MTYTTFAFIRAVYRLFVICFYVAWFSHSQAQTQTQSQSSAQSVFHGFAVDISRLNLQQQAFITPVLSDQLDIILNADLPPNMLAFMKTVPVVVDPGLPGVGNPALFSNAHARPQGVVKVSLSPIPAEKPVLLHEMLHAYDWSYWLFNNKDIESAYVQAKNSSLYSQWQNSHFMQNAKEFFAITGTVYLVGRIKQPPFDCRDLSVLQPEYVKFLAVLFGHHPYCDSAASTPSDHR